MENEPRAFIGVWLVAVPASLSYCRSLTSIVRPGKLRLLAVLPVIILFYFLPFSFSSVHIRVISASILVWLATFRLLLFSFDRGPLCGARNPLPLPAFIAIASLPIIIKQKPQQKTGSAQAIPLFKFAFKGFLFVLVASLYLERDRFNRSLAHLLFSIYVYLLLDLLVAAIAVASRAILPAGTSLEPQFAAPYLSSSLQDFWGRRWNLVVSDMLRETVHDPIRASWGREAGVMASFLVSALMHEIIFFYLSFQPPNGEVGSFFALHGVCTMAEMFVKKWWMAQGMRPLHRAFVAPLTVGFVVGTSRWLLLPQILKASEKETDEYFQLFRVYLLRESAF